MRIGFYLEWDVGYLDKRKGNILGDELFAFSMIKAISKNSSVKSIDIYGPNKQPPEKLDFMIYLNPLVANENFARKNIFYMQNGFTQGSDTVLKNIENKNYDGFIFISKKIKEMAVEKCLKSLFLPFGVDLSIFYPRETVSKYEFDVAYVGNDIKGDIRTMKYLFPATNFNFGLFGNWSISPIDLLRHKFIMPDYKKVFRKLSKGKIPQTDVPILYSSAKINLNCTLQDCVDWDVITLRTYEVLACKGFLISDKTSIAEKELSDCVIFNDGNDDLIEKIRYYLSHADKAGVIAENGYKYVIKYASIEARMKELLNFLGEF